jgi:hypothetical protein
VTPTDAARLAVDRRIRAVLDKVPCFCESDEKWAGLRGDLPRLRRPYCAKHLLLDSLDPEALAAEAQTLMDADA